MTLDDLVYSLKVHSPVSDGKCLVNVEVIQEAISVLTKYRHMEEDCRRAKQGAVVAEAKFNAVLELISRLEITLNSDKVSLQQDIYESL